MYQWYGLGKSLQKTCWEGLELNEGGHCHNLTGNAQHMETFHSWGHWTVINTCLVKIILFIMDTGPFSCYEHSFWIPSWIVIIYAFCVICDTEPQVKTMVKKTERCLSAFLPCYLSFVWALPTGSKWTTEGIYDDEAYVGASTQKSRAGTFLGDCLSLWCFPINQVHDVMSYCANELPPFHDIRKLYI